MRWRLICHARHLILRLPPGHELLPEVMARLRELPAPPDLRLPSPSSPSLPTARQPRPEERPANREPGAGSRALSMLADRNPGTPSHLPRQDQLTARFAESGQMSAVRATARSRRAAAFARQLRLTNVLNREDGGLPGRWLRQRREDAGLSQEELANRSGLSVRTVSSLERGSTRMPHPRTIRLLGETLGLPAKACDELIAAYRARSRGGPAAISRESAQLAGTAGFVVPREVPGLARHFVGREGELAALSALADQVPGRAPGPVVISAIGGTAGVGKTALALQWAHQVAERFSDGQLYVNLRGYGPGEPMTAGEALTGFLRALGVPGPDIPAQTEQRAGRYRGLLSGRRVLIILDNACGAGQVRQLLPAASGCVTLVTSRDTLAGLVARDGAQRVDLDLLPMADAVGLLRALIGSRVDAAPGAAAELAARCSRLPLALRVAAEIAAMYPARALADLASELEDQQQRLDVLDAGKDEDTAVRAVFSWSYRHLDADAARAFRLAGLHQGPDLDRYAAAALLGTTAARSGRLLDVLARGYLIQPTRPGRYAMHDLLRGYARELAGSHDGEQERHCALSRLFDYYLHSAAMAMAVLRPAERTALDAARLVEAQAAIVPGPICSPAAALTWLDAERACLLSAVEYMAENGWPGHASRMANVLLWYLDGRGHYPEAVILHGHGRRAARKIADRAAEARALIGLGVVAIRQGRYQDGTSHYQQALALFRQAGDTSGVAWARCGLGIIHRLQGRYRRPSADCSRPWTCTVRRVTARARFSRWATWVSWPCGRAATRRLPITFSRPWTLPARQATSTGWPTC